MVEIVTVIPNFFARSVKTEQESSKKWAEWYYSKDTLSGFQKRHLCPKESQIMQGKRDIDPSSGKEIIYYLTSKGRIIRTKLTLIKSAQKDDEHYSDYIIYIDGDGDIDFNVIFRILDTIRGKEPVCFSCRKGKYLMGSERDSIERFENYIVETVYNISLPDAQCGAWGFKKTLLENGELLTANGFEIELDILLMCLKLNLLPYFISIVLNLEEPSKSTSFKPQQHHREKLGFLIEKLNLPPNFLSVIAKNFEKEYPQYKLPVEYLDSLQEITGGPIERRLPKCNENSTCNRCDLQIKKT